MGREHCREENPVAKWGFCREGNTVGREPCREENPGGVFV